MAPLLPSHACLSAHALLEPRSGLPLFLEKEGDYQKLVSAWSFKMSQVVMGTAATGCFCSRTDPWTPLESFKGEISGWAG